MVEDIVDEVVELRLVDTRQLVKEAKKLKEAQRIKQEINNVLKKDPTKLAQEKELLKRLETNKKRLTTSTSPIPFIGDPKDVLPKSEEKKQTRVGAISGQKTTSAFTDMQKKIKELEKKQKKAIKKIDDFQNKFVDTLEGAESFLTSGSLSGGALGVLGGVATRFGPIGILIASAVTAITSQFFQEFQRGGIFSTALPITEREKNIVDIDYVVDVRSGTKFLTSDLRMAQKAPDTSNTLNLRYEHIRYTSQELGR